MLILLIALFLDQDYEGLIQQLGDKKFAVRQDAQAELSEMMNFSMYLQFRDRKESNPEIRIRLKVLANHYEMKLLSGYNIDLRGYPKYPFIDSLSDDYKWKRMSVEVIVERYLIYAVISGVPIDGNPNWTNYRMATEIWINERICDEFQIAISNAKSENELILIMTEALKPIQEDIDNMIRGDDIFWKKLDLPNPLRVNH